MCVLLTRSGKSVKPSVIKSLLSRPRFVFSCQRSLTASRKHTLFKPLVCANANELLSNGAGLEAADPIRRSDMRNNDAIFTRTLEVVQPASQR